MTRHALKVSCALVALFPLAAAAADAVETSMGTATSLQEVVVTATRRSTKLEQTPIAITVLDQATIARERITDFTDVAEMAPGLVFTALSRQDSYPSMRGATQGDGAAGANLAVTEFIDGVPTTGVGDDNPDLFDLQDIQVLRGPQGTLFGQNVTAGAIVVQTLPPSFTPAAKAQVTYGNYNLAEFRGYAIGPLISDKLAGKIAVQFRRQDGWVDDPYLNNAHLRSTLLGGAKTQLLWNVSDNLNVLFGADYNVDASPYKVQQLDGNFQPALFPPLYYGPNDADQGMLSKAHAEYGGGLIRVTYNTSAGVLTSISGLRSVNDYELFSTSADPENQFIQNALDQDHQITEEVHFASPADRRLTWVTGVFFLDAKRRQEQNYNIQVLPGTVLSYVPPYSALDFTNHNEQNITDRSYAVFGQADYAFTSQWKLSLGGRYTTETKSGHSEVINTSGLSAPLISGLYSHRWSAFTPKVTLDYQATPHLLTYLTAANGFKSGGYDTSATSDEGLRTPFQEEKVWSYEGGVKTTLFDGRLVVNADGYLADYTNLQVNAYNQALLEYITANAGVARVPGAEVEVFADPLHWLSVKGSYSYMGAYYTHYTGTADFSGNQIPFDPTNQYHLGVEAHFLSSALGGGTVRLGGDITYQSSRYFDDANDDLPFIHNHTAIDGLVNIHASWDSPDDTWEVSLWGKNVTGVRYIVYSTDLSVFYENLAEYTSGGGDSMHVMGWNEPAMYGISLTYQR